MQILFLFKSTVQVNKLVKDMNLGDSTIKAQDH